MPILYKRMYIYGRIFSVAQFRLLKFANLFHWFECVGFCFELWPIYLLLERSMFLHFPILLCCCAFVIYRFFGQFCRFHWHMQRNISFWQQQQKQQLHAYVFVGFLLVWSAACCREFLIGIKLRWNFHSNTF